MFGGVSPNTCMAAAPCLISCGLDVSCLSTCGEPLEPQNSNTYNEMVDCITSQCATCFLAENKPNCILGCGNTTCSSTWEPCLTGDLSCHEVLSCLNTCDPSDSTCTGACAFNGTPLAQTQVFELNTCWDEICGLQGPKACKTQAIYEECSHAYFACMEVK